MKVLITGAGGNLGRSTVPSLRDAGHVPRLFDARPIETEDEFVQGDIRNRDDVARAVDGMDAIIHAAALHGIHLETWTPEDFWAVNATGTFHVYDAAREAGITHIVLCSTMAVYGESMRPPEGAWGIVSEGSPVRPDHVYGLSKLVCEELARYHARTTGIDTVALRLGMFVPETFERYGFRLLFGGVDDRDVAQAAALALTYQPDGHFDAFNIFADVPFTARDAIPLERDAIEVIDHYWPGTRELMAERGLDASELIWGRSIWPPDKAKRMLSYRPRYGFGEFIDAFRRDDRRHYPFADLPWWGV